MSQGFSAHIPDSYFQSLQTDDAISYIGSYCSITDELMGLLTCYHRA